MNVPIPLVNPEQGGPFVANTKSASKYQFDDSDSPLKLMVMMSCWPWRGVIGRFMGKIISGLAWMSSGPGEPSETVTISSAWHGNAKRNRKMNLFIFHLLGFFSTVITIE